jgi:hypothetical protein
MVSVHLILIGVLILAVRPVLADDPSGQPIREVIQQQLNAFNADDYAAVYRLASSFSVSGRTWRMD